MWKHDSYLVVKRMPLCVVYEEEQKTNGIVLTRGLVGGTWLMHVFPFKKKASLVCAYPTSYWRKDVFTHPHICIQHKQTWYNSWFSQTHLVSLEAMATRDHPTPSSDTQRMTEEELLLIQISFFYWSVLFHCYVSWHHISIVRKYLCCIGLLGRQPDDSHLYLCFCLWASGLLPEACQRPLNWLFTVNCAILHKAFANVWWPEQSVKLYWSGVIWIFFSLFSAMDVEQDLFV